MKRLILAFVLSSCARSQEREPFVVATDGLRVALPDLANGALRIERAPGLWIELRAIDAAPVHGVRDGDRVVYEGAFPGTRIEHTTSGGRTEELRHVSRRGAFGALRYRFRLGPLFARLRLVDGYVEALDQNGVARLRTEPAWLSDARGTKRSLQPSIDGDELRFTFDDRDLVDPLVIDPAWTPTSTMAIARRDHAMALLPSGKVAVLGGGTIGADASSVEIWDPATGSFTSGGSLKSGRAFVAATTLSDGKVLVAGGAGGETPEIYDPATSTSKLTSVPTQPIDFYPTLTNLGSKNVLAVSGSAQLFDVSTATWTETTMVVPRGTHVAIALSDTKVLVAGGFAFPLRTSTAEVFELATKTWTAVASMKEERDGAIGQALPGGKAIVAGGVGFSTSEIWDSATDKWTPGPTMSVVHSFTSSVSLKGGKMLVMGGDVEDGITAVTEMFDPAKSTWSVAGMLATAKDEFPAVVLPSGKVLITGGSNGSPTATAEIFDPLPEGKACAGGAECTSTFCVDGFCCDKSACSAGETCGGSATPGKCLKANGNACAGDVECGSGHCVDGVCCDSACTDTCAACDVTPGTCVAVKAGDAPHGARTACAGMDACRSRCGGVDTKTCTQFPGTAVSCAPPTCKDGVESSARGCDGAGGCVAATTRPCDPYVCGELACKTQCDVDADCVTGNSCDLVTRKCVVAAKCDGDHTVTSPEGKAKDCTPYRCDGARCIDTCSESSACVAGFLCDTATQRCVPSTPAASDSGGCAYGPRSNSTLFFSIALMFVLRTSRRFRSRSPD